MLDTHSLEWIPLLVPEMPSPQALLPWLERMHAVRHYSNFGPLVQELESAFAHQFEVDREQLTCVSNATLGIELVLQALNLPVGARVLLPAFTFVATATAVIRAGCLPVLADVDAQTWMMTPEIARSVCARMRIDAVLPVATFGMPHDMRAWQFFEDETGLPVIIDAAAAYGSQWLHDAKGTLIFSLHATKSLPAGEGGVVMSTRPGLAQKVRQLSNFGINLCGAAALPAGSLAGLGTNAKMSEYHAAVGLESMRMWASQSQRRQILQADLRREIESVCGEHVVWQRQGSGGALIAPTLLCVRLPSMALRAKLEGACERAHITTRRWYQPLMNQMSIIKQCSHTLEAPHAQALAQTLLGLPFFLDITKTQRQRILHALQQIM